MRNYVPDYNLEPVEEEPLLICDNCGDGIYAEEKYVKIDYLNVVFCNICIERFRQRA